MVGAYYYSPLRLLAILLFPGAFAPRKKSFALDDHDHDPLVLLSCCGARSVNKHKGVPAGTRGSVLMCDSGRGARQSHGLPPHHRASPLSPFAQNIIYRSLAPDRRPRSPFLGQTKCAPRACNALCWVWELFFILFLVESYNTRYAPQGWT